jgi:nucleotide-binding universal stress UspA family protein
MSSVNFKKIVVPVDFSETSLRAVEHAALLAKKNKAEITFVHVMEEHLSPIEKLGFSLYNLNEYHEKAGTVGQTEAEVEERIESEVGENLVNLEKKIRKEGIHVAESIIDKGKVYKKVCSYANKLKADLIIMGTHGSRGYREFVLGSNTYKVVKEAKCPVLSIKETFAIPGFKNILLPFIDQPHMREHVDYAIRLAKIYNATITVLGIDIEKNMDHFKKIRVEAKQIEKLATKSDVKCKSDVFPASYVNEVIMNYAKSKKADLIVLMADIDKFSLLPFLTGPVVQQIVNFSPIPVLSIPPTYNPKVMW